MSGAKIGAHRQGQNYKKGSKKYAVGSIYQAL